MGMDVWVVYRDHGAYSDWDRDLIGVYGCLADAQAGAAALHQQYPTRAHVGGYADADDDATAVRGLGPWEVQDVTPGPEDTLPEPVERWVALPQRTPPARDRDQIEFYAERWPVQGAP